MSQPSFIRMGLCNIDSVDLGDFSASRVKTNMGGFCDSFRCCQILDAEGNRNSARRHVRILKPPDKILDDTCLDCLSAIQWRDLNRRNFNIAETRNHMAMKRGRK